MGFVATKYLFAKIPCCLRRYVMKKMKKILSIAMGLMMTTCAFAGCGYFGSDYAASDLVKPVYQDNFDLMIFGDHSLDADERSLTMYKEAGFNTFNYYPTASSASQVDEAAALCEQIGLDMIVFGGSPLNWGIDRTIYPDAIEETKFPNYFKQFDTLGIDFDKLSAVKGFYFIDEPNAGQFANMKDCYVDWYNQNYSSSNIWHANMFPSYATPEQLGVDATADKTAFEVYIETYAEQVIKHVQGGKADIGVDHYPLMKRGMENFLSPTYLSDLMVVSSVAHRYGVDFASCIQAAGWGNYRVPKKTADIGFQVYTNLALGAKRLEYYPYNTTGYDGYEGMFFYGSKGPSYDAVKNINEQIKKIDYLFDAFAWQGAKTITGVTADENSGFEYVGKYELASLEGIKSVSASYDALIGQFKDDNNYQGYMLVNYTEPSKELKNTIELEFNDAKGVLMYRAGVEMLLKVENNKLSVPLEAGEGVFIIPLNKIAKA